MLDPLEYANQLEKHGLSRPLAELIARGSLSRPSDVATKEDIANFRTEVNKNISDLRAETNKNIADLKDSLIKWIIGTALAIVAIDIGLAALFWSMLQAARP